MDNNLSKQILQAEQLIQAIEEIARSKMTNINKENVILCKIVEQKSNSIYTVSYDNLKFEAIAKENELYNIGDEIYVYSLGDDLSAMSKIILGKFTASNDTNLQKLNPNTQMTNHVEMAIAGTLMLDILQQEEKQISSLVDIPINLIQATYDRFCITMNLLATGMTNLHSGEYGLKINFYNNGNKINKEDYIFSTTSKEFYTNPYTINSTLELSKVFAVANCPIHLASHIEVILFNKNDFNIETGRIALTNLKITFGEDIQNYINTPISLFTHYNSVQSYDSMSANISPIIQALLIDQANSAVQSELYEGQSIRWYEQILGYPGDLFGGFNWKYIDTDLNNNLILDQYVFNNNTLTTEIKAVWCDKDNNIIGTSEPIVFKNAISNYTNNAQNTSVLLTGKNNLAIYNSNSRLQYAQSPNYEYVAHIDNDINLNSITWQVDTQGLIKGFIDPLTNTVVTAQTYTGNIVPTSITIVPRDEYQAELASSAKNKIKCIINGTYTAVMQVTFELLTTQGTNYIFQIEPLENTPYLLNTPGSSQTFQAKISMADGTIIPIVSKNLTWSWYQYDTYQNNINEEPKDYIDIRTNEINNTASIILNKAFDTEFADAVINDEIIAMDSEGNTIFTTSNVDADNVQLDEEESSLPNTGIEEEVEEVSDDFTTTATSISAAAKKCNTHILQAKYLIDAVYKTEKQQEITRTIELVALYPIKLVGPSLKTTNLTVEGIFELNWTNEGELTTYSHEDYDSEVGLVTQENYKLSTAPTAIWDIKSETSQYYHITNYTNEDKTVTYYLQLPEGAKYVSEKVSITAVDASGNLLYQQPLMLTLNNFSIDMTNKWAGGVVTIDEEAATIMATAMGAGHKNVDNSFTGVLMGDVQLNQLSEIDSGLFGFNNGQMIFKLNKEAEFFVGSDKDNYISFKDNFFDLKTQTLKLNALANSFIIDSTGTSPAKFEYQKIIKENVNGEEKETTVSETIDVDNAVLAANNNFIVTADGYVYAKNVKEFEMAPDSQMTLAGNTQVINQAAGVGFTLEEIKIQTDETAEQITTILPDVENKINTAIEPIEPLAKIQDNMVEKLKDSEGKVTGYALNVRGGTVGSWFASNDFLYATADGTPTGLKTALVGANISSTPGFITDSSNPNSWYLWFKGKNSQSGFGVDKNGTLYAKNGIFYGTIEAGGGHIGGWTIASNNLWYRGENNLRMISGEGVTSGLPQAASGEKWAMWFGPSNTLLGANFGVTNSGLLYAKNAMIDGHIDATSGIIGGWNIAERPVSGTSYDGGIYHRFLVTKGDEWDIYQVGMKLPLSTQNTGSNLSNNAFYVTKNPSVKITVDGVEYDGSTKTHSDDDYIFSVTYDGQLTAKRANITGTIVAENGNIAGFNIGPLTGYSTNTAGDPKTPNAIYTLNSSNKATSIICGDGVVQGSFNNASIPETWQLWFGKTNDDDKTVTGTFGITKQGIMYANGAVISGTITATAGKIGGWNIVEPNNLSNSYLGGIFALSELIDGKRYRIGLKLPKENGIITSSNNGNFGFYVAEEDSAGANRTTLFGVAYDGSLYATKANIVGAVKAESFEAKQTYATLAQEQDFGTLNVAVKFPLLNTKTSFRIGDQNGEPLQTFNCWMSRYEYPTSTVDPDPWESKYEAELRGISIDNTATFQDYSSTQNAHLYIGVATPKLRDFTIGNKEAKNALWYAAANNKSDHKAYMPGQEFCILSRGMGKGLRIVASRGHGVNFQPPDSSGYTSVTTKLLPARLTLQAAPDLAREVYGARIILESDQDEDKHIQKYTKIRFQTGTGVENDKMLIENTTGYLNGTWYIGTSAITSDINLKEQIQVLAQQSKYKDLFYSLKPVSYALKDSPDQTHLGLIAQEVEQSMMQFGLEHSDFAALVINKEPEARIPYALNYIEFIPLCIQEIQSLAKRIEYLEQEKKEIINNETN